MRFNKFDLNLLVALDALLDERSVSRAAARLNLSPSATSDALARLREYFADELLVQVGRRMEPTPRAEGLQHDVRDMLMRLESTITTQPSFDATRSDRVFRIFVSDYTQMVFAPHVLALAHAERSSVRIDFLPQVAEPQRSLERGEVDLLIIPSNLMSPDHPTDLLYTEDFVCVVWKHGSLADGPLTLARYLEAGHAVMQPQANAGESFEVAFTRRHGVVRRVAVSSFGFAPLPALVVGTNLIATVHARLARLLQGSLPIALHPSPVPIGPMEQALQWHQYRTKDPGLAWLRSLMRRAVERMQQGDGSGPASAATDTGQSH